MNQWVISILNEASGVTDCVLFRVNYKNQNQHWFFLSTFMFFLSLETDHHGEGHGLAQDS